MLRKTGLLVFQLLQALEQGSNILRNCDHKPGSNELDIFCENLKSSSCIALEEFKAPMRVLGLPQVLLKIPRIDNSFPSTPLASVVLLRFFSRFLSYSGLLFRVSSFRAVFSLYSGVCNAI